MDGRYECTTYFHRKNLWSRILIQPGLEFSYFKTDQKNIHFRRFLGKKTHLRLISVVPHIRWCKSMNLRKCSTKVSQRLTRGTTKKLTSSTSWKRTVSICATIRYFRFVQYQRDMEPLFNEFRTKIYKNPSENKSSKSNTINLETKSTWRFSFNITFSANKKNWKKWRKNWKKWRINLRKRSKLLN